MATGALRRAGEAARENLLPGVILQILLAGFLVGYFFWPEFEAALVWLGEVKARTGLVFALGSYIFAGAFLPELMRVVCFQGWRIRRENVRRFLLLAPFWGFFGIVVDGLYGLQAVMFGDGSDVWTIVKKVAFDQFLFSPFFGTPAIVGYFRCMASGFNWVTVRGFFKRDFFFDGVVPVQVAGWCVWIPAVAVVYLMPTPLQLLVAVFVQAFWVLLVTTLTARRRVIDRVD